MTTPPAPPPASPPDTYEAWLAAADGNPTRFADNRAAIATAVNATTSPAALWTMLQNSPFLSILTPVPYPPATAVILHSVSSVGDALCGDAVENIALCGLGTTPAPMSLDINKITSSAPITVPTLDEILKATDPTATPSGTAPKVALANFLPVTPDLLALTRAAGPSLPKILTALVAHVKLSADTVPHTLSIQWLWAAANGKLPIVPFAPSCSDPALKFALTHSARFRIAPPVPPPPAPAPPSGTDNILALQVEKLANHLETVANNSQSRRKGWHRLDIRERTMFLNIGSTDGAGVPDTNPPTPRLREFFAKQSSAVARSCFKDFLDDLKLTHSVFPGLVSALYLGQIIRADNLGLTGLAFSPFQFPKKLAANASSTQTGIQLHLTATEGSGLSDDQARETGRQGCFVPITADQYKHQLQNFVAAVLFLTSEAAYLYTRCTTWSTHFADHESEYEDTATRQPLLYASLLWMLDRRVHEYLVKARRAVANQIFAPDALSDFHITLRRVLDGENLPLPPEWIVNRIPDSVAHRAGQLRGIGLTNATTAAILGAAPVAKSPARSSPLKSPHGLLPDYSRVVCQKTDYPFRCTEDSEYGDIIDRFRRTTLVCLPKDPLSRRQFCGKFFFRGWCTNNCNLPHHQSISDGSVADLTEFGHQARAWCAINAMPADEASSPPHKGKWKVWDDQPKAPADPAPDPALVASSKIIEIP